MPANNNGNARWTRWIIGILIFVLLAVLSAEGAGVVLNRVEVSRNTACIKMVRDRLERIEGKLDRALGLEKEGGR